MQLDYKELMSGGQLILEGLSEYSLEMDAVVLKLECTISIILKAS